MKNIYFLLFSIFLGLSTHADYTITRGPNTGEIYFIGLTSTGEGIYYSSNYGETAVCQDYGSFFYGSICADKTPGVVYLVANFEQLYLSTNYGLTGSWEYRNSGMAQQINSGRVEGEIFSSFSKHSEDYGQIFISHSCNGYFGNRKDIDLDPLINNVGYVLSYDSNVLDTVYMFVSYDKFENLQIVKKFNFIWSEAIELTRGTNSGEIFLFNYTREFLLFSNDYATSWINLNSFNIGELYSLGIVGGRIDGEVYIKCDYVSMGWNNANTYILYSSDYGISFEIYHPFSKGQEPLLANYSAKKVENDNICLSNYDSTYFVIGEIPLDVQFYNYSIGDINNCEWDFDNDGIIDSYEQTPVYTYVDTGWYSVSLTVYDDYDTNSFLRENYIYVDQLTGIKKTKVPDLTCYPNPFSGHINIRLPQENAAKLNRIEIYDISGALVKTINTPENETTWNGENEKGQRCRPGIYFVKSKESNLSSKILLTY